MKENFLHKRLVEREEKGLLRSLPSENNLIDFSSNDYLGLAGSAALKKLAAEEFALAASANKTSLGSTGSRLLTGNLEFAVELEKTIAKHHRAEAGLIYNSGYDANVGLLSCVAKKGDVILYDELSHASIHDGVRLSKADSFPFRHNDVLHLAERLAFLRSSLKVGQGEIFVVMESVYSMDGDFSPLVEIASLCEMHNANLIVDEAHATGVFGEKGEGKVVELGLEKNVFARVHTFGKALGCHGAVVLGSEDLRSFLINFSRSFIYTTALPFHSLSDLNSVYKYLVNEKHNSFNINSIVHLFVELVKVNNVIGFLPSFSPIQSFIFPGNQAVKKLAASIQADGFDVRPILSPTVPAGKERIRICLHTFNTEQEISNLLKSLKKNMDLVPEKEYAN